MRGNLSVSHTQEGLKPAAVIFENACADELSPLNHRSVTFSFPAPSVKAPPPPCNDQANSVSNRLLRKTQSNPITASSLPDILDESLYESPKKKKKKFINPAPYSYFVPTVDITGASTSKSVPSNSDPGETEFVMSSVFAAETNEKMDEKFELNAVTPPHAKAKPRVSRLQSDPLRSSSGQEYAETFANGETRARFYSYTGMRIEGARNKVGALKTPMPLPTSEGATEDAGRDYSAVYAILEKPSSLKVSELETTLDSIEELDEILDEQESLSRSSSHKRHKEPKLYLDFDQLYV